MPSRGRPPRGGRTDARGQVLVLVVFAMVALMAAAGLAFDVGRFYSERRFLQNAADAGALAIANALVRGESSSAAEAQGRDILTRNLLGGPTGSSAVVAGTPEYQVGHAGDPLYLESGILMSGGSVRVAVRSDVDYTFGRAVGLDSSRVIGQAHVRTVGDLLPIAVRRFVNTPGPNAGASSPCSPTPAHFIDYLATADTSCLGTETDGSLRSAPSAGMPFDPTNLNNDPAHHGPVVEILGLGAQPSNGADFRGFVALDVRDFEDAASRQYYNGATPGMDPNTLQAKEAAWFATGYPGPLLPASTWPTYSYDSQVAIMSGNSTGIAIDRFDDRYKVGDEILVAVYSGQVAAVPDFALDPPSAIAIGTTETLGSAGTFKVSANSAFAGVVDLDVLPDAGNPNDPILNGQVTSVPAITFTPNPVSPSVGVGTTVTMSNIATSGATPGIYTLWLRGHTSSPYLRTHFEPISLNVGGVIRDFAIMSSAKGQNAFNAGDTVAWTLSLKTGNGPSNFNGTVNLSLDGPLPAGLGAVTFSSSSVSLGAGPAASATVVLSINSGSVAPNEYEFVVRATGTNSAGFPVTHLVPITLRAQVSPPSSGYVDVLGYAVFRVAQITSNVVTGYAITPSIQDLNDPQLRRGQVARLVPWN